MTDVWQLENEQQTDASEDLNIIAECAYSGNKEDQGYLKTLWPECNWQTIKKRLATEGSIWYVWWMDGVNQHILNTQD